MNAPAFDLSRSIDAARSRVEFWQAQAHEARTDAKHYRRERALYWSAVLKGLEEKEAKP